MSFCKTKAAHPKLGAASNRNCVKALLSINSFTSSDLQPYLCSKQSGASTYTNINFSFLPSLTNLTASIASSKLSALKDLFALTSE